MHLASLLLVFVAGTETATIPGLCSIRELRQSPGYRYRVERIRDFIQQAPVIVRAEAVSTDSTVIEWGHPPQREYSRSVLFAIRERLRGDSISDTLRLPGRLVPEDDFNPLPVPYQMVRMAGQRGDCFAREYRRGAEYLLILNYERGRLSPHWMGLAPFNEQLRGAEDPWLLWVRDQVRAATEPRGG